MFYCVITTEFMVAYAPLVATSIFPFTFGIIAALMEISVS